MLTADLMAKVRRIEILTRRKVSETFSGDYASAFRGLGMEFDEVRQYQPGDDVRTIDWNVTARTGEPYIKRYREERQLTVLLAVDVSRSQSFGSTLRAKRDTTAELAAVLAYAAARNNDRVGLCLFSDHVERFIAPRKGRGHTLRVVREILEHQPVASATDLAQPLEHLQLALRRRAVIFLISDFLTESDAYLRPLAVIARKHDVVALSIADPADIDLPGIGLLEFQDAETGQRTLIDTASRAVRNRIADIAITRRERLAQDLRRLGVDHEPILAGEDYAHQLTNLFHRREARR